MEMLDGEQATWCEIAGVPTLFVDLSQTASEQLQQVEGTLAAYSAQQKAIGSRHSRLESRRTSDDDLAKRVA
jgi:hypothetical protein